MMHAAETAMEVALLREGRGPFAEGLRKRGIEWHAPKVSPIQYLSMIMAYWKLDRCWRTAFTLMKQIWRLLNKLKREWRIVRSQMQNSAMVARRLAGCLRQEIAVGLGSDSVASNNTCDLIEEARLALLLARSGTVASDAGNEVDSRRRWLTADDVFRVATMEGARALSLDGQIGELRAGLQADFAVVSLDRPHQTPSYDVAGTLMFASSGRDVVLTVVAGREVYRDGRVTTVDEDRLRARMKEIAEKLAG